MTISIIIPCYNVGMFLSETLESIISQTFRDFEVICIDDGSTDNSLEIIELYCKKDSRIKYITQPNSGVSTARNKGLLMPKSDFVCFIDGDDTIEPDFLFRLIHMYYQNEDIDLAICRYTRTMNPISTRSDDYKLMNKTQFIHDIHYEKTFTPQICCMLFRRSIIDNHNITFIEGCTRGEDREFFLKYVLNSNIIAYSVNILYHYREHPNSAMASLNPKSLTSIEASFRLYEYCKHLDAKIIKDFEIGYYSTIWKFVVLCYMNNQSEILCSITSKYDVSKIMKLLQNHPYRKDISLSSHIYTLSPQLFGFICRMIGRIKN